MKNIILSLFVLVLVACKKEPKQEIVTTPVSKTETVKEKTDSKDQKEEVIKVETSKINSKEENPMIALKRRVFEGDSDHKDLLGSYVGIFVAASEGTFEKNGSYYNKINVTISYIKKDSIFGHSVVAGNSRAFKGILNTEALRANVLEPGDDKYDGVFEFSFYPEKKIIKGTWIANDLNLSVSKRQYKLEKKNFQYNPELNLDGNYRQALSSNQVELYDAGNRLEAIELGDLKELNSSTQELHNQDIENLNKGELEVLRNLIYARHGYSFKNRKMRYFFDSNVDWYIPVSTDIRSELTDLEKKNIDLIKRYEQHAERYYDYFGR